MSAMPRQKTFLRLKAKAARVDRLLTKTYGREVLELDDDPLDTLVETILSQNTTDVNSHRSFTALKKAYPSWGSLLGEDYRKVSRVIRSGGLPDLKAQRILHALAFIQRERGRLELDFLRNMDPPQADAWLARIKGVGPKTRSIVLLFSLGMPAFPVDTHVHRVSRRLGLVPYKITREKAQDEMARLVPKSEFYNFHVKLIQHGRAVCRARNPRCEECMLRSECDYIQNCGKSQS